MNLQPTHRRPDTWPKTLSQISTGNQLEIWDRFVCGHVSGRPELWKTMSASQKARDGTSVTWRHIFGIEMVIVMFTFGRSLFSLAEGYKHGDHRYQKHDRPMNLFLFPRLFSWESRHRSYKLFDSQAETCQEKCSSIICYVFSCQLQQNSGSLTSFCDPECCSWQKTVTKWRDRWRDRKKMCRIDITTNHIFFQLFISLPSLWFVFLAQRKGKWMPKRPGTKEKNGDKIRNREHRESFWFVSPFDISRHYLKRVSRQVHKKEICGKR